MKNLFLGLSLAAMALLAACSSGSGTNSVPLEISSNSSSESFDDYDGEVEFFDDLPKCSEKKDGKVYYVEDEDITYTCRYDEDEEAGEWINASEGSYGSSSSDEGKSSASEEPESSGSEGVEGSSASVSGEMVSCDIPGVMGECMEYPVGSDEAAQLTEFCVSMLSGTLGTGCAASTRDSSVYDADKNTLTDLRDGQTYKTVKIGDQVWMAENLNFVTDNSWCYKDESDNCAKYGRLYTWAAAVGRDEDECGYEHTCGLGSGDIRGACPKGWHLPSKAEWEALIVAVDGSITEYTSSNTAGTKLKSVTGWYDDGNGTNAFGFSALPASDRYYNGRYYGVGRDAYFWSSAEIDSDDAYDMSLYYSHDYASLGNGDKGYGFSVRCLKD